MKQFIIGVILCLVFSASYAADNSGRMRVTSITTRDSGNHVLHFGGAVPAQGCTYNDRAVIVGAGNVNAKALLDEALISLTQYRSVVVRVSGCATYNPTENSNTAPQIIRLTIF